MSSLPTTLRRQLETACKQGRTVASIGARKALEALAVHEPNPYGHMDEGQRDLRRKLRAQARQLGDVESQEKPGGHEIKHLVEKLAYDQWHRLLFARFLMENNLLISPEHEVSVSLEDCQELASSLGLKDAWAVAARFAAKELPQIFRADDSAGAVDLAVEDRKPLIQLVTGLPAEVFTASDSLGWCYQFWQAERKDEVNAAGNSIGADELPAVTQLFTEDYMVDFLLDNTLGAWHAGKILGAMSALAENAQTEEELRSAVALPGCPWKYLRFIKAADGKWTPAAGTFDGWPNTARELKCLDPCMGSGHFVVAIFERLVAFRIAEEGLNESGSMAAVIRDNLFGLELDPRCTQIGAFNLALAAWRRAGHCTLPAMNLSCSGLAPNATKEDWVKLAGDNDRLQRGMARLYSLFNDAPVLGSLINPRLSAEDMFVAEYHELQPLLETALAQETKDDSTREMAVTAHGLAKAAETLAGEYTLVITNVPYLGRGKQNGILRGYLEKTYRSGSADLATAFLLRCLELCAVDGSVGAVLPQNWLFQVSYTQLRMSLLKSVKVEFVIRLGPNAFQDMNWWAATTSLFIGSKITPNSTNVFANIDASSKKDRCEKTRILNLSAPLRLVQDAQLMNPDASILGIEGEHLDRLIDYAAAPQGIKTGDDSRWLRTYWELDALYQRWQCCQTAVYQTCSFGGASLVVDWSTEGRGMVRPRIDCMALGKRGVAITQTGAHRVTLYYGNRFDSNITPIIPTEPTHLPAMWAFMSDPGYSESLSSLSPGLFTTNSAFLKVPFDLAYWQQIANEQYAEGLPAPTSDDPTQWLFNGHPRGSVQPMHVAVARLLGYQWPRQTGSSFPDCPALGTDGLEKLADEDGIVCLSATKGEGPAAERLRGLLVQALGSVDLNALIANAGPKGSKSDTLEEWLRDEFFEQHCTLFQHRPFVWHVWDGHKGGFSALVNYHKLTHANLEKLTYVYLGDWIRRQQAAVEGGEAGSDVRLQVAKQLQARLKLILEGEPPYDLFVRWKPLSEQAIGWHPDINDGVRMNIRPFAAADILRKRVKITWDKDRGKESVRDKKEFPWFWGWDERTEDFAGVGDAPDGNRWNDCHYTNEFKRKANAAR